LPRSSFTFTAPLLSIGLSRYFVYRPAVAISLMLRAYSLDKDHPARLAAVWLTSLLLFDCLKDTIISCYCQQLLYIFVAYFQLILYMCYKFLLMAIDFADFPCLSSNFCVICRLILSACYICPQLLFKCPYFRLQRNMTIYKPNSFMQV
jgi:hypothetical protein